MKNITPELKKELFPENLILLGYRGSISHNMYVPNTDPNSIDDIDLMGIYMAPIDHYIGIKRCRDVQEKFIDKWDVVNYEFLKFINLLLKSNPNVLSLLWLKNNFYIERNIYGKILIESRDLFVSKLVFHSFTGYAYGQLKKMEATKFEGYMGKKRKELVEKFGYDCKNATHCIRLLKMGIEFLTEGKLNVFREDAPWLLEIKRGLWKLEDVKSEAKRLFNLADEAYIRSNLPSEPNYDKINIVVKSIMHDYINKNFTL
jgi:predicted nucleotidyltransferase